MNPAIGLYLKKQRELRNIPLQTVSEATKINLRSLQALESSDLNLLPGSVFAKGFVRSYAKAIGLDVEEATLQLEEHLKENDPPKKHKFNFLSQKNLQFKPWMMFVFFLLIVVTAAYFSSR